MGGDLKVEGSLRARGLPCVLGIMTKAPQPGLVKTRLVPPLSHAEAAELHRCFLRDTAENIVAAAGTCSCRGAAVYTPGGTERLLEPLLPDGFQLVQQRGETLGERLLMATADVLELGYPAVCLIDSDSPTLPTEMLTRAVGLLERPGARVVLGPADDGGYYLIGLKAADHRLFAGIAWSTAGVFTQTVQRAKEARLDIEVLPSWYDVDDGPSLDRLCAELSGRAQGADAPHRGYYAPHTRRCLAPLLASCRKDLRARFHAADQRSR